MFSQLAQIDEFLVDRLVRPFYYLGCVVSVLLALVGWLFGLLALSQSAIVGILTLVVMTCLAGLVFLGVRLAAESVIALFRIHKRFVGGGPKDAVPN
jgi:hypothetical protein